MVGGGEAGRAAEGIIAKAVKDLFRAGEKDAAKAGARDAGRSAARNAARDAERQATRDAEKRAEREAAARAEERELCRDPVDVATGEVVVSHVDATLAGQTARFASGNGLVAIDVDEAIRGGSRFIDHGNVMQAVGRAPDASRLKPFAERAGEVLFIDHIPFSAMTLLER